MASQHHPAPGEPQAASKEPTTTAAVLADNTGQPAGPEATGSITERGQVSREKPESPKAQIAADLPPGSRKKQGSNKDDLPRDAMESGDEDSGFPDGGEDRYQQTSREFVSRTPTKTAAGILYVNDEYFADAARNAKNFHIIVSTSEILSMDGLAVESPSNEEASKPEVGDPDVCSDGPDDSTDDTDDSESGDIEMESFLPIRLRIMNRPLRTELGLIAQKKGVRHFYENHTAPFRSIIPHEKEIRSCLRFAEEDFAKAQQDPGYAPIMNSIPSLHPAMMLPVRHESRISLPPNLVRLKSSFAYMRAKVDGLRALVYLLDHDLRDLVKTYWKLQKGPVAGLQLPYLYLSYLFKPGQDVVNYDHNGQCYQAYRVIQVLGGTRIYVQVPDNPTAETGCRWKMADLRLICQYYEYDGDDTIFVRKTLWLPPYDGRRRVTGPLRRALPTAPLSYHPAELKDRLIERGIKYSQLNRISHRRYRGLSSWCYFGRDRQQAEEEEIDSDVIIDVKAAYRNAQHARPEFHPYSSADWEVEDGTENELEEPFSDDHTMKVDWFAYISNRRSTTTYEGALFPSAASNVIHLLPYEIWGYVLLQRKWLILKVDLIEDIPQNREGEKDGFDRLILPDGHKEIVRALVKTHARIVGKDEKGVGRNDVLSQPKMRQFDVVKGKGKALILLLHGAPGVGKTSTAECVAANANRPLFPITCGDLGSNSAQEVETNLEKFFELARKWSCVLLLDEADVFLSSRQRGDIRQNSLVSVFLRVLEYYSGILILTTNRVGSFDEAVRSRIHCALYYPPLDKHQTLKVWEMNLDLLEARNEIEGGPKVRFDREEIMKFARRHWRKGEDENRWNGRQIRNAFQTAVALAAFEAQTQEGAGDSGPGGQEQEEQGPMIHKDHFETVWRASDEFNAYLSGVRRPDHLRAREDEVRDDRVRTRVMSWPADKKGKKAAEKKAARRHGASSSSKGKNNGSAASKGKDRERGKSSRTPKSKSSKSSSKKKKSQESSSEEDSDEDSEENSGDDDEDGDSGSENSSGSTDDGSESDAEELSDKESSEDDEPPPETRKKSRKSKSKK
ncbi:hypothetical protein MAPG_02236 [Magnaporthiopsis poae ATCC 64411]|uniref:AAA+ ATPase domain-containing protein n=1 Tax=Magnaporthiopsis poae (strain ATCC 64411 / 73-15) TaxID=644358 RepID=A0A0C4DQT9_MAGP6|nr:hypothetical protein MAPG_02236 [Magnaporthiopsis poae ATCC 64411]